MSETMKAAMMYGPNDIRVEETEKPACPKDGLILKIMSVGLCGSDIRNLTTDSRKGDYPFIYMHQVPGRTETVPAPGHLLHGVRSLRKRTQ